MCYVIAGDLGARTALLDERRMTLIVSDSLDVPRRREVAREAFSEAGQEQPGDGDEVVCLCGLDASIPPPRPYPPAFSVLLEAIRNSLPAVVVAVAVTCYVLYRRLLAENPHSPR